ncbi:hypothetical protein Trydic_g8480 [Trypoxylus dichotomus]
MDEVDANYQVILWRSHPKDQLKTYKLLTVTYGTTPYLATRCLNQLAIEVKKDFPTASNVLMHFYVDDLLTGVETVEQAYQLVHDLKYLLHKGGFT